MRLTLLIFFTVISSTASAQLWRFKKHERLPLLDQAKEAPPLTFPPAAPVAHPRIGNYATARSDFNLEAVEDAVMKEAQHNMRFRIYNLASYNFSDLAQLYAQQNRFSEAKWYFLQSVYISRQQNNYKLTLSNLCKLAMVKALIGDFALAKQDLTEARDLAASKGWLVEIIEIEKKLSFIQHNRYATLHGDRRYADDSEEEN
jgi:hypothetical protein